ncbi:MAG: S8 family serine peptidase [Rhodobacteraceae bacterium]|nr:S8 family serine peptidase [Paracoccaceae bacterium]
MLALAAVALLALAPMAMAQSEYDPYEPTNPHDEGGGRDSVIGSENRPARVRQISGGRYEYVVIGPAAEAVAAAAAITDAGGTITRSNDLGGLGQRSQIATFPGAAAYEAALAAIARLAPQSSLGPQHLYNFAQAFGGRAPRLYAPALIGDAAPGRCHLARPITIGMIDGPINTDHPALRGVDVTYETVVPRGRVPAADHGTGVAALLVGEDESGALAGFARGARLYAVSVFSSSDLGEEASVELIAEALDRLVRGGVRLINMSIAGPENAALARAITAAAQHGAVLVAASGNNRRAEVAWPAAAPEVIAVTAVDAARRRFYLANTGAQLEFAAPGVDVYAARGNGGGYVSGTSFAAPIVTALAARQMAAGAGSTEAIRARLRATVEALGPGQRNTDFGWGLVQAHGC